MTPIDRLSQLMQEAAELSHGGPLPPRLWLDLERQKRRLSLAARRLLSGGQVQKLALAGVPDLSLELLGKLTHGALLAQGAESWSSSLQGERVHRYAFAGRGRGPAVLLLHGLGGTSGSMATLVQPLLAVAPRVVLLDLPGHGRSPSPAAGPLSAQEYGGVVEAAARELAAEHGRVVAVGNSLGGALALHVAHALPREIAGVVGLNPAGAAIEPSVLRELPRGFDDARDGAARMAELLFHRTPWLFWLVARDYARGWGSPTVQRILDDARTGGQHSLGLPRLSSIAQPVLILWGAEDRLLPASSVALFQRDLPHAQVELIPGCGHVPQIERAALTRRRVREFVAAV